MLHRQSRNIQLPWAESQAAGIFLIFILCAILAACSLPASQPPPTSVPTATLGAILSPTPTEVRITPPTQTPSITPTPTHSLTPSVTPLLYAFVRAQRDITVYSGPSEEFIALALLLPAEQVVLRGRDESGTWYFVQLRDGRNGWVPANFLQPESVQTESLPAESVSAPDLTASAGSTAPAERTPAGTAAPIPPTPTPYDLPIVPAPPIMPTAGPPPGTPSEIPPTPEPPRASPVFALCDEPALGLPAPQELSEGVLIVVWWAWLARTADQIQQHLDHVEYDITVDGVLLSNWAEYQVDPGQEDGNWVVYWYVPFLRELSAGEHRIEYRATWRERIFDGIGYYGPGSNTLSETGSCTFTVHERSG